MGEQVKNYIFKTLSLIVNIVYNKQNFVFC